MNEQLEIRILRAETRALTAVVNNLAQIIERLQHVPQLAKRDMWNKIEALQYAGAQEQQEYDQLFNQP